MRPLNATNVVVTLESGYLVIVGENRSAMVAMRINPATARKLLRELAEKIQTEGTREDKP